jgi:hypothetical protein
MKISLIYELMKVMKNKMIIKEVKNSLYRIVMFIMEREIYEYMKEMRMRMNVW